MKTRSDIDYLISQLIMNDFIEEEPFDTPNYSTSVNDAWKVVQYFESEHKLFMIIRLNPNGYYECTMECNGFCDNAVDGECGLIGDLHYNVGDLPLAICLTALDAIGYDIEATDT